MKHVEKNCPEFLSGGQSGVAGLPADCNSYVTVIIEMSLNGSRKSLVTEFITFTF